MSYWYQLIDNWIRKKTKQKIIFYLKKWIFCIFLSERSAKNVICGKTPLKLENIFTLNFMLFTCYETIQLFTSLKEMIKAVQAIIFFKIYAFLPFLIKKIFPKVASWSHLFFCFPKDLHFYSISIVICDPCWSIRAGVISIWVFRLSQLNLQKDGILIQDGRQKQDGGQHDPDMTFRHILWTAWPILTILASKWSDNYFLTN